MPHQVPWLIEKALHPAEVGRQLAYAAFQGEQGVSGSLDCRVAALDIPGPYIRAFPGSYAILNRGPGAVNQMYTGRISSEDVVGVQNTTSSGGRTDLVVIRIENPDIDGTAPPSSLDNGPYAFTRIIQNVPSGTTDVADLNLGYSAITLARIQMPPSTSTVTNSMITDLRGTKETPVPAPATFFDVVNFTGSSSLPPPPQGSGTRTSPWKAWPVASSWQVPVPTWATEASIFYQVMVGMTDNTWGAMRMNFNGRFTPSVAFDINYPLVSGATLQRCVFTNGGAMRHFYTCGGRISIASNERGTTVPLRTEAQTFDNVVYQARGSSIADAGSMAVLQVQFKQAAASA